MGYYDHEPKASKGMFLRLKAKGDSVVFRIASPPYREPIVWKKGVDRPLSEDETGKLKPAQWAAIMREPDYQVNETYHWVVIDRADGQARIFTGAPMVYKAIKAYALKPSWGDPMNYDIEVTRTEKPGSYYEITALPDKTPLSESEIEAANNIIMAEKKPNAAPTDEKQIDDIEDYLNNQMGGKVGSSGSKTPGYDTAKAAAAKLKKQPEPEPEDEPGDDVVIEDIGDEPINLDDIPF